MLPEPPLFDIAPDSGVPFYRQLIDQVYALIAGGHLQPGDRLPSVRQVARLVAVNPMTVSKAYTRLEADGVLQRVAGQTMRILKPVSKATFPQRQEQFRRLIRPAIHRAQQLGLNEDQLIEVVRLVFREQKSPQKWPGAPQSGL
jgi:GntR family transcriptional regulator